MCLKILIYYNMFQYPWNENEMYLFKANIAYALRQYYAQRNITRSFTSDNIITTVWTPRISFYFMVRSTENPDEFIPKDVVVAAIR